MINMTAEDRNRINEITKDKDDIKKSRAAYERQWLINIAFLYGKHYFTVERKQAANLDDRIYWEFKNIERQNKVKRTSNYILPLFRSVLAKIVMMKSHVDVEPTTNSEQDEKSARVSNEAIEDFWQNVNKQNNVLCQKYAGMQMVVIKLFTYMLALGTGYLKPYFNARTKGNTYLNNKIIPEAEIGNVEVKVLHHFNCYLDPLKQYYIEEMILPIEYAKRFYGVKEIEASEKDVELPDQEKRLIGLLESPYDIKYKNAVKVLEKTELPSEKYPNGRVTAITDKQILLETDLPPEYKGKLNIFEFNYLDFMLSPFAQGIVDQLISLQEDYNYTVTRLYSYKKWLTGKVMIPRGANISTKWDDEVGQLIFYDSGHGKPDYQVPPGAPSFMMEELIRIRKDMEDTAGSHDSSMGRVPSGVKSGVAIESLSELDNAQLNPTTINIEQQLSFFVETVLNIMAERYSEPRLLAVTGDDYVAEVKSFIGSDLIGNRRVKATIGSSLPFNKEARQQKVMELMKIGLVTPDKAKDLLEFGDIDGALHSIDETAERIEIQQLLRPDIQVVAEPWEDHTIRLTVLTDYMKGQEFQKLPPEMRQKFVQHMQEHQEYLRGEAQAAQKPPVPTPAPMP